VIRAKRAPTGREIFELADEPKGTSPLFTWRREGISGATHRGTLKAPSGRLRLIAAVISIVD